MSELRRWSAEGATSEEVALLEAGRRVQPSETAQARARALRALGAGAAVATIGTTAPLAAATKSGLTLASKVLILSLVGSGVVAGAVAVRTSHPRTAPTAGAELPGPRPQSPDPARPEAIATSVDPPAASVPVAVSPAPSAGRTRSARPTSSSDQLTRETKALELAHRALAEHDPRTALGILDRYRAQFPDGSLASEAVLLRVQALLAIGDRAGAQALADSYSAANPGTPYSRRIKEIVRGD
jgi:hypothetical protein